MLAQVYSPGGHTIVSPELEAVTAALTVSYAQSSRVTVAPKQSPEKTDIKKMKSIFFKCPPVTILIIAFYSASKTVALIAPVVPVEVRLARILVCDAVNVLKKVITC